VHGGCAVQFPPKLDLIDSMSSNALRQVEIAEKRVAVREDLERFDPIIDFYDLNLFGRVVRGWLKVSHDSDDVLTVRHSISKH